MTKEELLAHLEVERYDNRWWSPAVARPQSDDEVTCRRRLKTLTDAYEAMAS